MRGRLQLTHNARFIDRLSHLEPKLEPGGGPDMGHRKPLRTGFPNVRLGNYQVQYQCIPHTKKYHLRMQLLYGSSDEPPSHHFFS